MKKMSIAVMIFIGIILSGCDYFAPITGTYSFSSEISEREQDRFIIENEKTMIELTEKGIMNEEKLKFYVTNYETIYYNDYTDEIGVSHNRYGYNNVFAIFKFIYHEKANYGLMFGLADCVAIERDQYNFVFTHTEEEVINYVTENPTLMNLNYLQFDLNYVSPEVYIYSAEFSSMFAKYIIEEYSFEWLNNLLKEEDIELFSEAYYDVLNEYTESLGIPSYYPDHYIVFSRNTIDHELSWSTERANWILDEGFFDIFFYKSQPDMFRNSYFEIIDLIYDMESELDRVTTSLGRDNTEYPIIEFNLVDSRSSGFYNDNVAYLSSIFSLSHEYVHHLQSNYINASEWLLESMAVYYSTDYEYIQKYFERIYQLEGLQAEVANAIKMYKEIYGEDAFYEEDVYEFSDVYVYANNQFDDVYQKYSTDSFFQYISFTHYFINTYGEELYIQSVIDELGVKELTGSEWIEIIAHWESFIESKY